MAKIINNKLIKYDNQTQFELDLSGSGPNTILPNSIVFIKDKGRI